jgi:phage terminase large subunit-like protein
MLKVDRDAIAALPPQEKDEALRLLESYREAIKANPLIGYRPHAKQVVFHEGRERIIAFLGGNRSGKTTAGILDDLVQACDESSIPVHLKAYKKFEPPFHCRIVCPGDDIMHGIVHQKLREWAPKDQLVGGRFDKAYEKSRGILHFKNGSFFDFLTFGQDLDKFGGTAKHRIHYDEEPPEDIYKEGKMRLMDYQGADTIFTMTPQKGMDWMFEQIWEPWQKGVLKHGKVVVVDMDENPHLSPLEKEIALEGYSKEELQARKQGLFVHFHGMIYHQFSRMRHVIPQAPIPEGVRVDVGIDPGTRHPAAVVWTYLTAEDMMVVFDELRLQGHTAKQVCDAIKLINAKHGRDGESKLPLTPHAYVIDPSVRNIMHNTGRSLQSEYTDHDIVTILGQNDVNAGINRVTERLENRRLLVMANCAGVIDEFRKYRWSTPHRSEDDPKERPVKSGDDLMDALRYVVMSRPYAPQIAAEELNLSPMEKAAREDMTGKSWNRRKVQSDPNMGGVFA